MSGPKVVRIVSPEEMAQLEARRDKVLAELRKAIEKWHHCLTDLGMLADDKRRDADERCKLLEQEFFPNFSKSMQRARDEIRFLEEDADQARIEARAKYRARRRNLASSAATIVNELKRLGQKPSEELLKVIDQVNAASEAQFEEFQRIVNGAMHLCLKHSEPVRPREAPSELATNLAVDLPGIETFSAKWQQAIEPLDHKNQRLDHLIAEMETLFPGTENDRFAERASTIAKVPSNHQKALLTDSLILDLASECKARREQLAVNQILMELKAELADDAAHDLSALRLEIDKAITNPPSLQSVERLAGNIRDQQRQELSKQFSANKRKAILNAFAELGYEIRDGMETFWTKNGKLVVTKLETPTIGVELGAGDSLDRLQMRAVAVTSKDQKRDQSNDVYVETAWCGEIDKLKKSLKDLGHDFIIEQAQPIGKIPLKICEPVNWITDDLDSMDEQPAQRKLNSRSL